VLEALSRAFLRPRADAPAAIPALALTSAPPPAAAMRLAVACAEQDGSVAAGAAGLAAATAARCDWALLAARGTPAETPVRERLPARAARRAAEALRMQGHTAWAVGRLVHVALPPGGPEAAASLAQLAATPAPMVLVAAGPRDDALEGLLARHDRLLLVTRGGVDPDLVALARSGLAELGGAVRTVELLRSPAAAALARSGTALVAPLRAPFLAALDDGCGVHHTEIK